MISALKNHKQGHVSWSNVGDCKHSWWTRRGLFWTHESTRCWVHLQSLFSLWICYFWFPGMTLAGSIYRRSLVSCWCTHSSTSAWAGSPAPSIKTPGRSIRIFFKRAFRSGTGVGFGVELSLTGSSMDALRTDVRMISASKCKRRSPAVRPILKGVPPLSAKAQSLNFCSSTSWPGRLIAKAKWDNVVIPFVSSSPMVVSSSPYSPARDLKWAALSCIDAMWSVWKLDVLQNNVNQIEKRFIFTMHQPSNKWKSQHALKASWNAAVKNSDSLSWLTCLRQWHHCAMLCLNTNSFRNFSPPSLVTTLNFNAPEWAQLTSHSMDSVNQVSNSVIQWLSMTQLKLRNCKTKTWLQNLEKLLIDHSPIRHVWKMFHKLTWNIKQGSHVSIHTHMFFKRLGKMRSS